MRIMVIEDHPDLRLELADFLTSQGYNVVGVENIASMQQQWHPFQPNVIILDLNLPDGDGLQQIPIIRQRYGLDFGIIVVSARGQAQTRTEAHMLGADGYLVKPVYMPELLAILKHLSLRLNIKNHVWVLFSAQRQLRSPSMKMIGLTKSESQLLTYLIQHRGCHTKSDLQGVLWPFIADNANYSRLDTMVCRLRKKVHTQCEDAFKLETERLQGYELVGEFRLL